MTDFDHARPLGAGVSDARGPSPAPERAGGGMTRRRMIGYLVAAATLVAAAE